MDRAASWVQRHATWLIWGWVAWMLAMVVVGAIRGTLW